MQLTIEEIIKATGGRCLNKEKIGNKIIVGITTDTRQVKENSLFIPLKGERFDGHAFIDKAFEMGAVSSLTENIDDTHESQAMIWVPSTHKALLDLAAYYRKKYNIPIVAVTGSVGKTTTKDLIAAVLSAKFNTLKTEGNFNNEIGMPLTLFRLEETHEIAVVEMGMNHFNEIERLSKTAQPDMAVITNIGVSHIENLGSREGILQAKLEIVEGLKENAPLIINGDDTLLQTVELENHPIITIGMKDKHMYHASDLKSKEGMSFATITTPKNTYEVVIPALGEHMITNSLVAIAVAEHFDLSKEEILQGLMTYTPSKMRMNIEVTPSGLTIIDDAYNASPDSMLAALKVLKDYEAKGKRIAILGDMFEMGAMGPVVHQEVGRYVAELGIEKCYAIGELATHIIKGIEAENKLCEYQYFSTKETFLNIINQMITPEDVVLVKASRGMHFEDVVKGLRRVNHHE